MIKIDLNDLLDNYNTNLLDNLRGFGSNEEYLKFYVPGTSSIKSFYNLIDALLEAKQLDFIIFYKEDSFEKKLTEEIFFLLEKVSINEKIIENNFINLKIKLDKILYKKFQDKIKPKVKESDTKENIQNKADEKNKILVFKSEKKLNEPYIDNIHKVVSNDYFSEKKIIHKNMYLGEIDGFKLNFIIENRIITKIFHDCDSDKTLKKLINIFCDVCINRNIQEAAEHSVIYLEEKIRRINNHLIKTGIILPSHAGTYFDNLNNVIRNVYYEFIKKNSIIFGINKNYSKKSYHWVNLDEQKKLEKINFIIKEISAKHNLKDQSVTAQTIENNFKVNLGVDKSFKSLQETKNILLEIEIKLKILDETIEVFVDEFLDKNKLRLKNSPQTKLLN